jgi:hypothetical protein
LIFKGEKRPDGKIVLIAQEPPGCLRIAEERLRLWIARLATAALWFLLGLLVGLQM